MITVQIIPTGSVLVSPQVPYDPHKAGRSKVYGVTVKNDNKVWLPVCCYLIRHPKGLILVDTGWARKISPAGEYDEKAQRVAMYSRWLPVFNKGWLPQGQAIDEQLATLGVPVRDLDYVILTHLDCDHVSGLQQVKEAKHILVSDDEINGTQGGGFANQVRYRKALWDGVPLTKFQWNDNQGPFNRSYDLFGDGSIELINLPGHSNGLVGVKITNAEGKYVLLTSDAAYSAQSWREMVPSGVCVNRDDQMRSLEWIRQHSLSPDCLASISTHDPEVEPKAIEL